MNRKTILVVDDEEGVRALFEKVLALEGYVVECASNGQEALSKARAHAYDLYIIDLKMPGIDGYETHDRIRELYPDSKAFFIAAYASPDMMLDIKERGLLGCIRKPFRLAQILKKVEETLEDPS